LANRRSTREAITKDLKIKIWEKRATTYVELLQTIDRQDVSRRPSVESIIYSSQAGKTVSLLESDMLALDWKNFEANVEVCASMEVRQLYACWKAGLSWWTFSTATHVMHLDNDWDHADPERFLQEKKDAEAAPRRAHNELLWRIRSELEFKERKLPSFHVYEVETIPGMMRVKFLDEATDDELPTYDFGYIQSIKRDRGSWVLTYQFPARNTRVHYSE
jgi:hypothetical protein